MKAVGLQQVDGLEVSDYLRELSYKEIEGKLTHYEIEELLYKKYEEKNRLKKELSKLDNSF